MTLILIVGALLVLRARLKSSSRRKEALTFDSSGRSGPKKLCGLSLLTSAATTEFGVFKQALSHGETGDTSLRALPHFGLYAIPLALVFLPALAFATDLPHTDGNENCANCHLTHRSPGGVLNSVAGNANLCQSCHVAGGQGSAKALSNGQQAQPWPGLPTGVSGSGTSHRWDAGVVGRAVFLGGTSTGTIETSGTYTGAYAKTYTLTITTSGNSGGAQFNWIATTPGGGAGTNLLTGTNVLLNEGLLVTFKNGTNPSFQVNDQWNIYVRPDLRSPTNLDLLATIRSGLFSCSTCHDEHSQAAAPFDPDAQLYVTNMDGTLISGTNRHYMRIANDTEQLCQECHAARFVTNAGAGSHPVGMALSGFTNNSFYRFTTSLPLEGVTGNVRCETCHAVHNAGTTNGTLLRLTNSTATCAECHTLADVATPAAHLNPTNANTKWPGGQYGSTFPARPDSSEPGTCQNCHAAHGWPNATNSVQDYATLLVEQEENLCFTCHDGSPLTKNLQTNYTKTYRHPTTDYSGRHRPKEAGIPGNYGSTNRHAECTDCHNAHQLASQTVAPVAPTASSRLKGVARVSVTNGAAGSTPTYTFRNAADPTPGKEFELCFLCHSSWTTQPAGQTNYAVKFNPNNPSYHPIEGPGKNLNVNSNAFVNNWRATNTMFCTDCHTSDDPSIRGPHASTNLYILKKPYTASSDKRTMTTGEICFDCHRYDTYANTSASAIFLNYSRFSGEKGHAFHVGRKAHPCYACHDTHASTSQASLIVTGRIPGINTYTRTTTGGTCAPTCHDSESYTVSYPR